MGWLFGVSNSGSSVSSLFTFCLVGLLVLPLELALCWVPPTLLGLRFRSLPVLCALGFLPRRRSLFAPSSPCFGLLALLVLMFHVLSSSSFLALTSCSLLLLAAQCSTSLDVRRSSSLLGSALFFDPRLCALLRWLFNVPLLSFFSCYFGREEFFQVGAV